MIRSNYHSTVGHNEFYPTALPSNVAYKRKFVRSYLILVLASLILLPSFGAIPGLSSLRLDDFLLVSYPLIALALFRSVELDRRVWILLLIGLSFLLGFSAGTLLGFPSRIGDLFFSIRILKYIGAVCLATSFVVQVGRDESFSFFAKASLLLGLGAVLIALQQYFDLGSLNSRYVNLIAPTQFRTLVDGYSWPRPVGMVGNPNEFGYLLVLLGLVGVFLWSTVNNLKFSWKMMTIAVFSASVLTMSRSSIFAGLIGLAIFLLGMGFFSFSLLRGTLSKQKMMGMLTILFSIFSLAILFFTNESLFIQITWRFMPEYFGSFAARESAWIANYEGWRESILFGIGPLRHGSVFGAADNEHFLLLRTGGIILYGLVIMLLSIGIFGKGLSPINRVFQVAIGLSVLAYMVPAVAFYSLVVFPYLLMLLVILAPMPAGRLKV